VPNFEEMLDLKTWHYIKLNYSHCYLVRSLLSIIHRHPRDDPDLQLATELVEFAEEIVDVILHCLCLYFHKTAGLPICPVGLPVQGQLPDGLQLVQLLSRK